MVKVYVKDLKMLRKAIIKQFLSLILLTAFTASCGSAPVAPDTSREEMEDRRDEAFRELK